MSCWHRVFQRMSRETLFDRKKVFGNFELDVLNSENSVSVLVEFLDRYLLEDELINSWNTFEGFEKFERKRSQNIR